MEDGIVSQRLWHLGFGLMAFLISLAYVMVVVGVFWAGAFYWAKRNVPASRDYADDPARQRELLQTPISNPWRTLLQTPMQLVVAVSVAGPILLFFGVMPLVQGLVWAKTPGVVTRSQVVPGSDSTGYQFSVEYQFTANGKSYHGREVSFGDTTARAVTLSKPEADALQAKYSLDEQVTVHYDAHLPYDSVLETRIGERGVRLLGVGVALTLLGLGVFALYLRALRWSRLYREVASMQAPWR